MPKSRHLRSVRAARPSSIPKHPLTKSQPTSISRTDRGPSRPSCCNAIEMEPRCWYECLLRHQALGSPPFSPTTSSRESATQEMHAYPLQPREGMEDGGSENDIILQEKSNVFSFPIEAPQDVDFFDQPKLSPEEI